MKFVTICACLCTIAVCFKTSDAFGMFGDIAKKMSDAAGGMFGDSMKEFQKMCEQAMQSGAGMTQETQQKMMEEFNKMAGKMNCDENKECQMMKEKMKEMAGKGPEEATKIMGEMMKMMPQG